MKYIFTQSDNALVVTTDTESGRFPAEIKTYTRASADLANDRIYLREYGMDKQNFAFHEISTIDGVAPTDLEDAFDKLLLLIANFNGGGGSTSSDTLLTEIRDTILANSLIEFDVTMPIPANSDVIYDITPVGSEIRDYQIFEVGSQQDITGQVSTLIAGTNKIRIFTVIALNINIVGTRTKV